MKGLMAKINVNEGQDLVNKIERLLQGFGISVDTDKNAS